VRGRGRRVVLVCWVSRRARESWNVWSSGVCARGFKREEEERLS
jgi:hypothetical protein